MAETAPKWHRGMRRAGFQQATQLLSHIRCPTDTRQLTSPQGEADVQSLEGVWHHGHWGGGEFTLRLIPHQKVAPLYWRSDTHTHTLRVPTYLFRVLGTLNFLNVYCASIRIYCSSIRYPVWQHGVIPHNVYFSSPLDSPIWGTNIIYTCLGTPCHQPKKSYFHGSWTLPFDRVVLFAIPTAVALSQCTGVWGCR